MFTTPLCAGRFPASRAGAQTEALFRFSSSKSKVSEPIFSACCDRPHNQIPPLRHALHPLFVVLTPRGSLPRVPHARKARGSAPAQGHCHCQLQISRKGALRFAPPPCRRATAPKSLRGRSSRQVCGCPCVCACVTLPSPPPPFPPCNDSVCPPPPLSPTWRCRPRRPRLPTGRGGPQQGGPAGCGHVHCLSERV